MKFLKKIFTSCKHEFRIVDKDVKTLPNFDTMRNEVHLFYILQCSICGDKKSVRAETYDRENGRWREIMSFVIGLLWVIIASIISFHVGVNYERHYND